MIQVGPVYVAFADYRLNFYPGTLTQVPGGYKKRLSSQPMSYIAAHDKKCEWMVAVGHDSGFTFGVDLIDEHNKHWR